MHNSEGPAQVVLRHVRREEVGYGHPDQAEVGQVGTLALLAHLVEITKAPLTVMVWTGTIAL
jgi:hypothetical protein